VTTAQPCPSTLARSASPSIASRIVSNGESAGATAYTRGVTEPLFAFTHDVGVRLCSEPSGTVALGARVTQALTQVTAHALLVVLGASVIVVLLGFRPTGTLLNALKDR